MFMQPDNFRLANLKLEGLHFGALVWFCPRCDFQVHVNGATRSACPKCELTLVLTMVTPDLVRISQAA